MCKVDTKSPIAKAYIVTTFVAEKFNVKDLYFGEV